MLAERSSRSEVRGAKFAERNSRSEVRGAKFAERSSRSEVREAKRGAKREALSTPCPSSVQAVSKLVQTRSHLSKLAKDALTDTRNIPKTLSRTCPNAVQAVSKLVQTLIILSKPIKDTSKSIANYSILSSKLSVQLTFL